ncbi:hypothetical protein Btru_057021 [Bulinus truncatus]|nr:hypothetical protein Btru_057021 [Bulinus truncatus]
MKMNSGISVVDIVHKRFINNRSFEIIDTNKSQNEQTIGQSLLKAMSDTCNASEFIQLCIRLNNLEVANEYGEFFKVAKMDRDLVLKVLKHSLKLDHLHFIQYLMEQGLRLQDFLNKDNIKDLAVERLRLKKSAMKDDYSQLWKRVVSYLTCSDFLNCTARQDNTIKRNVKKNQQNDFDQTWTKVNVDKHVSENGCGEDGSNHGDGEDGSSHSYGKDDSYNGNGKDRINTEDVEEVDCDFNDGKNKDGERILNNMFTEAIFCKEFDLAFILWKSLKKPTIAALYAIEMINEIMLLEDDGNIDEIDRLNKQIRKYEDLALNTLNKTYENSSQAKIFSLLIYESEEWKNSCCIVLAMKNNSSLFLSQIPYKKFNKKLWRNGYIYKSAEKEHVSDEESKINKKMAVRKFLSPSVLTLLEGLSHGVFLILYAMWLISVLEVGSFHWLEWLLWSWIVCYGLELVNQCVRNPIRKSLSHWNTFNYMEIVALSMFLISWTLRLAAFVYRDNTACMEWTRILFSIDFMIYAVLPLEYCYTNKFLGPKLIIILKMTKVLVQFLLIILAFFLSFAVASQAVLYPNSKMNPLLAFHILKRPFWSAFGEFSLDDLDSTTDCTTDSTVYNTYTKLRCPSEAGSYYVPVLMGIYVIIVNILLFNLLIALFNSDISLVETKAEELWNLQTLIFTFQQSKTMFLPPPFFILSPLLIWCRAKDDNEPFSKKEIAGDQSMIKLRHIEAEQRDICCNMAEVDKTPTRPVLVDCPHKDDHDEEKQNPGKCWTHLYGQINAVPVSPRADVKDVVQTARSEMASRLSSPYLDIFK